MRISPDAEQRVLTAARELGYRPSLLARGLRSQLTQTIGLISDVVATEPYAGQMIRGAMSAALAHDQLVFVAETGGDPALEAHLIQSMFDRGVSGFIYAAMYTRVVRPSIAVRRFPLVLLNCVTAADDIAAVVPDEHDAGRSAARVLLEAGHRDRIYLVGEHPPGVIAGRQRLAGITEELSAAGTQLAGLVESLWWPEPGHDAVRGLLATDAEPSALICLNDRRALGAYQAVTESGRHIPDDVSIVSFDGSDLASWLRPQLTSVAIPHLELGRRATELLLGPTRASQSERVRMPLRKRGSVGPPRWVD